MPPEKRATNMRNTIWITNDGRQIPVSRMETEQIQRDYPWQAEYLERLELELIICKIAKRVEGYLSHVPGTYQTASDLAPHPHGDSGPKQGRLVATWIYTRLDQPNYLRVDKHQLPDGERRFYQHHWNGARWLYGIKGTYAERKIPYRLPELKAALMANPDTEVHIAEGEKDAGTLARLGFIATTNPGGALSWTEDLTAWFRALGCTALLFMRTMTRQAKRRTAALNKALSDSVKLRIIRYPDVPAGEDVTWWIDHGHTREELAARIAAAPQLIAELGEWDAGEDVGPPSPRCWLLAGQSAARSSPGSWHLGQQAKRHSAYCRRSHSPLAGH